ncbi:hypothetical protein RirG_180830 [Rhizophagus irregularis DAOM 197198w]|uniref:Endonuclease/exonuclease/phosphatase domain-containing protein n=1 Tax=Rhizophagus irregularis (strain DAOM 197198w) TaxID=1432141 RepID=A0A015ISZ2_RHIIW|nr:hypothetical protein RirG_180830 [Rhizophagus irregularis DAOM 197198w]
MTQMQTLIDTLQVSQTSPLRLQPVRKAKRTSIPYKKTPLKEVKKWFIQPSAEPAMEDSNALPLSDEYYTESGEVSDTGIIENTYEASEQDTSGQSSFILNPFNCGSINIQTAFNNKLNDIINYFVGHNFDILGLSETGLFGDQSNTIINKHKHPTLPNNFIYIVHDTSGSNKGSGVAIMITDKMEKHLQHTEFLEGRIINLIFGFKKSKQLNVTCCYLPSSPKNDITKSKISAICVDKLNKLITKSNNTKNSYAIVIGDFNVTTKNKSDPNYPSIRLLKNNGYKDMIKYHQESLDNNSTHNTNRIDYHFGNTYLLEQSIHSYTQSIPQSFFNTDHNIVITLLEKTFFDSRNKHLFDKFMNVLPFNKRNEEAKKFFKYDQMTKELWSSYTNRSCSTFKKRFSKEPQQINNKTSLN